jgi:ribonuclease HI
MGDETTDYAIFTAASLDRHGGGWAAILARQGRHRIMQGTAAASLDGLELLAMLVGLAAVPPAAAVCLITRNDRLYRGLTVERERWRAAGWRRAGGQPLGHGGLWQRLDTAFRERTVSFSHERDLCGPSPLGRVHGLARAATGRGSRRAGPGPG